MEFPEKQNGLKSGNSYFVFNYQKKKAQIKLQTEYAEYIQDLPGRRHNIFLRHEINFVILESFLGRKF